MNKQNEFLNALKYEQGETSQKQVVKEAIKSQLFRILGNAEMQKGESKDLNETVEEISNNLGLQHNKDHIAEFIKQLFRSDRYEYDIDEKGNIRANYSRIYMIQKELERKGREEAQEILQGFIQKVERHVNEMEQKKEIITDASLMNKFSKDELRKDGGWIDIAIDHVLEIRKKQEIIK